MRGRAGALGQETRDDAEQRRETEQRRDGAEQRRENPAEFRAINVNKREPELAGEARFFIGSAQ